MSVLLINPIQSFLYENTKIKAGEITAPVLSLSAIAGALIQKNINVKIIDLLLQDKEYLYQSLENKEIEYTGITFTTPLYPYAKELASDIKTRRPDVKLVCGGAHATSMPEEVLADSDFDVVIIGEGDFSICDLIESGGDFSMVKGIAYNIDSKININPNKDYIEDLDELPYPAWDLYDISSYKSTGLLTQQNPVGWMETSRGCLYGCVYCNKNIFGRTFRVKSPKRVVDEMEYMISCGFEEIHIADDGFTTDMKRAEDICDEIIKRKIKILWATVAGIRVDRVNPGLLRKMKKAGCYRVFYGIETGSDKIYKMIKKGVTIEQAKNAVKWGHEAGLEIFGFFMFGLPGDTQETMKQTTDFALELDLDMAKASITVPFPGTPLFYDLEKQGRVKTKDWQKYNLNIPPKEIYDHTSESWDGCTPHIT